jgi:hypothetical protein
VDAVTLAASRFLLEPATCDRLMEKAGAHRYFDALFNTQVIQADTTALNLVAFRPLPAGNR